MEENFSELEALGRVKKALAVYPDLAVFVSQENTSTAELAAKVLGVSVGQIAKSLCFLGEGQLFLLVTVGDKKVNTKKLAKEVGCKKVRFAEAEAVQAATGFLPGGVCPFALLTKLPIYVDVSLFAYEIVYAAAGTSNSAVPIAPKRLQEITEAKLIDVMF